MKSVLVDGYGKGNCPAKSVDIPSHLQSKVDEIWYDSGKSQRIKHEEICFLLKINRFYPEPSYKSYAVRATRLSFFNETTKVGTMGGWHECAYCHLYISVKPQGNSCPQCKRIGLTNYGEKKLDLPCSPPLDWFDYKNP